MSGIHGRLLACTVAAFSLGSLAAPESKEGPTGTSDPATAASSTAESASAPAAATSAPATATGAQTKTADCPPPVVEKRILAAANLTLVEEQSMGGGVLVQGGGILSSLGRFGGLFDIATTGAGVSGMKKVADAMAADPCGDNAVSTLPKYMQEAYKLYRKNSMATDK
jgi:hypothetical protein